VRACYEGLDAFAIVQEVCKMAGAGAYLSVKRVTLHSIGWTNDDEGVNGLYVLMTALACGTGVFCNAV
jgi:hypothetical protein